MSHPRQIAVIESELQQPVPGALAPTGNPSYDPEIGRFRLWCADREYGEDAASVQAYLYELQASGIKPNTLEFKLSAIKAGFKQAFRDANKPAGLLDDPFKQLRKKIPRRQLEPPKTISREEYELMLAGARPERAVFIRALWETGARVSEICGLRRDQCEVHKETVTLELFGKGSKLRSVPMRLGLYREILTFHGDASDYVFPARSRAGKPVGPGHLNRSTALRWIVAAGKAAGVKAYPHIFRHSYATRLIQAGVMLPLVQRLLGHVKLDTTMIYTHLEMPVDEILEAAK